MIDNKKNLTSLIKLCLTKNNPQTLLEIFNFFLTPEEQRDLGLRLMIIRELLKETKPQRQIAEELEVSLAKITRGSNELKRTHPKFI